jgi:hypothetical protein
MMALTSRTKERRAAKRQQQCSASASTREPFATSSSNESVHSQNYYIHRNREGDDIGGATPHAHTRSRCQSAKAQGPSELDNPT